ncbi:hypothetical protein [Rubinisphaera margarita]|uniref:hypothetical protein n=1 Tax=Rubinisphaera margarita TaxID=2909586 RepID=UPI001EE98BEC|nr:hypothetical protein [Rubinisphaera margarita]MCG6158228.1 hypothetical protein [Rubinisphaera margarita]
MSSRGSHHLRIRLLAMGMIFASPLAGCGHEAAKTAESIGPALPESFSAGEKVWTRDLKLQSSDEKRLEEFFADNPSLTENPRISGNPLVYRSSSGTARFYWIDRSRSPVEWSLVEIGSRKGRYEEGQGGPF